MLKLKNKLKTLLFELSPRLAVTWGVEFPRKSTNRLFLEQDIFEYLDTLLSDESAQCLFIGTDKRSWHYRSRFAAKFFTIDKDPRKAIYGDVINHRIDSATELARQYTPNQFDVIIANGLIGFGVDHIDQCEDLFAGLETIMKGSGVLVVGYSNSPSRIDFKLEDVKNYHLFEEFAPHFNGLDQSQYVFGDHVFVFLRRAGIGQSRAA
jgi:hypothetical protein